MKTNPLPPASPPRPKHRRTVSRNGDGMEIVAIGRPRHRLGDAYVNLMGASWIKTILLMILLYLLINLFFACAYLAIGDGIEHARPGSFTDAFFFSVQTLATIGYGGMSPKGIAANLLVTVEAMFGFAYYGVVTGLFFSKFSRPTARILFSDSVIIGQHNGQKHLMLRLVNQRSNGIVDAHAKLTLMRDEVTTEGVEMRRFYDLPLVRREIPYLSLSWTVMHCIDDSSPLYNMSAEDLEEVDAQIVVSVSGMDDIMWQTVHARHRYQTENITCNAAFEDIIEERNRDRIEVHYERFHNIRKLA